MDPVDQRDEYGARQLVKAWEIHRRELGLTPTGLLGLVPPFFNRLGGRYRWQILIRSPDPDRLLKDFKLAPRRILELNAVSTVSTKPLNEL